MGTQSQGTGRGRAGAEGRFWGRRWKICYQANIWLSDANVSIVQFCLLTRIFAIAEDTGSTAATSEESQCRRPQPVHYTALPRTQCNATGCRKGNTDQKSSLKDVSQRAVFSWSRSQTMIAWIIIETYTRQFRQCRVLTVYPNSKWSTEGRKLTLRPPISHYYEEKINKTPKDTSLTPKEITRQWKGRHPVGENSFQCLSGQWMNYL